MGGGVFFMSKPEFKLTKKSPDINIKYDCSYKELPFSLLESSTQASDQENKLFVYILSCNMLNSAIHVITLLFDLILFNWQHK